MVYTVYGRQNQCIHWYLSPISAVNDADIGGELEVWVSVSAFSYTYYSLEMLKQWSSCKINYMYSHYLVIILIRNLYNGLSGVKSWSLQLTRFLLSGVDCMGGPHMIIGSIATSIHGWSTISGMERWNGWLNLVVVLVSTNNIADQIANCRSSIEQ